MSSQRNTSNSIYKENSKLANLRALSIKDVADLVPSFSGSKENLDIFIDGCIQARNMVSPEDEKVLAVFIKTKLSGTAGMVVKGKQFNGINDLIFLLEKRLGDPKSIHLLYGQLSTSKQLKDESVGEYANKVEELGRSIKKQLCAKIAGT